MQAKLGTVKVSRRGFLAGAGATAAVLTAGGAAAGIVMHERGGGSDAAKKRATTVEETAAGTGPNPLDDADTRLRHLLRRTSFVALPADVERYRGMPLEQVVDDLLGQASVRTAPPTRPSRT